MRSIPIAPCYQKKKNTIKFRKTTKTPYQTRQKEVTLYPQPFLPAENSQKHQEEVFLFNSLFKMSL